MMNANSHHCTLTYPLIITLHIVCAVHRGCAVQRGMFSTPGDIMSTVRGDHEYTGGCLVHWECHEYTRGIS